MSLTLKVNAVDRTSILQVESLQVEQIAGAFASTCSFALVDSDGSVAVAAKQDVRIFDGAVKFFRGEVATVRYETFGSAGRIILVKCNDLNMYVETKALDTVLEIAAAETDEDMIDAIFAEDSCGIADWATHVSFLHVFADGLALGPCTVRRALDEICRITGGKWYIEDAAAADAANPSPALHYFDAEGDGVGWELHDVPDDVTKFAFLDKPRKVSDGTTIVEHVYVVGKDGVEGWHPSEPAAGHDYEGVVKDDNVWSAADVTEKGTAVLAKYGGAQTTYIVKCTRGTNLRAGRDIKFTCALYDVATTFVILKLIIRWPKNTAEYELHLGEGWMVALERARLAADIEADAPGQLPAIKLPLAARGWGHDLEFSSTDEDTVAWGAGTIEIADGVTTFSIVAGNTGNMAAVTYIYFDRGVSTTVLQTSTDIGVAVGGKDVILIAVAQNVADADKTAIYQVYGGSGGAPVVPLLTTDNLAADCVTANLVGANQIITAAANIASAVIGNAHITSVEADRIQANKLAIGTPIFTKSEGLLLLDFQRYLKPSTTNQVVGSRGEKMDLTGALHIEQGRWLSTKALVIEEGTVNLLTNPSVETNTTGWSAHAAGTTITRVTDYAAFGSYSGKVITPGTTNEGVRWTVTTQTSASTEYTLSMWLRGSGTVKLRFYDSDAGYQWGPAITLTPTWTRHDYTATFGTGAARYVYVVTSTAQAVTFYVDGVQLEQKAHPTTYCDGSLGDGYTWSGTAHASTSTRTLTALNLDDFTDLISGNIALSFHAVVQAPFDADDFPAGSNAMVFSARGADNDNYVYLSYRADNDYFWIYLNGSYITTTAAQTFKAGDFITLDFTLDFTGDHYRLYIDGIEADHDTTAKSAPTLTDWQVGSYYTGASAQGGWAFSEYSVFDRVLTAAEVAQMFNLQRPLVDMGATDKPGIYIVDGQFRLLSSQTGDRIELTPDEGLRIYEATTLECQLGMDGLRLRQGSATPNYVEWYTAISGGKLTARLSDELTGGVSLLMVDSRREVGGGATHAALTLRALDVVASKTAALELRATDEEVKVLDNMYIPGKLRLGTAGSAPADGDIQTSGDVRCSGVISTDGGTTDWELGDYNASILAVSGYVNIWIDGQLYCLLTHDPG